VYVVDNDAASRELVARLARSMDLACQQFDSGLKFLEGYDAVGAGCLVTACRVADISGLQIQRRLLDTESSLPVIFVTAHASVNLAVRAMRAGAIDVLEKPCNEQELWEDIQHAIRLSEFREQQRVVRDEWMARLETLTPEERETLDLLLQGAGNRKIASNLGVTLRTVEARRQRVMEKLQVETLVELLLAQVRMEPRYCFLRDATCFMFGGEHGVEPPAHFRFGH